MQEESRSEKHEEAWNRRGRSKRALKICKRCSEAAAKQREEWKKEERTKRRRLVSSQVYILNLRHERHVHDVCRVRMEMKCWGQGHHVSLI